MIYKTTYEVFYCKEREPVMNSNSYELSIKTKVRNGPTYCFMNDF
jgi:hypothetical protein